MGLLSSPVVGSSPTQVIFFLFKSKNIGTFFFIQKNEKKKKSKENSEFLVQNDGLLSFQHGIESNSFFPISFFCVLFHFLKLIFQILF
jgi:hypothetical protein